jgi:predicted porin
MKTSSSATTAAICLITFFFGMCNCLWADQSQEMAELKAAVAAMQKTIVQLQGEVAALKQQQAQPAARQTATSPLAALKEAVLPANAAAPTSGEALKPAPLFTQASTTPQRPMVYDDIQASPLALNSDYGPRFAGFHELGDSGWWIHVGGLLKADLWFGQNNGTDTVTNALDISQSRIHADLRSDSDLGPVRLYFESNFDWRVRHLYAQIGGLTFGQTWSAFYDPSAAPDMLNNLGTLGYRLRPQIRYTFPSRNEHFHLTMAVESNPTEYLYGAFWTTQGTLSSRLPDFLVQARWEAEKGHLQLAGVLRDLHYASRVGDNEQDTLGYGLSLSGALHLTQRDHLMAGLMAGNGINGYFSGISNDSATLNNDDTIDMQQAWSAFIGYQHLWNDKLRSQISWRHDSIEKNLDRWNSPSTEGDTLQANLIWAVNAQLHAGFEYQYSLLNETTARDQEDHSLMFSLMYRFF